MPEAMSWITGLGEIGGVVAVVILFLRYMKTRDDGMQEILNMLREEFKSSSAIIQEACKVMGEVTTVIQKCKQAPKET